MTYKTLESCEKNKVTDIAKLSNLLKIRNSNHFNTTVHENHIRTWIDIFDPSHSKQLNLNLYLLKVIPNLRHHRLVNFLKN